MKADLRLSTETRSGSVGIEIAVEGCGDLVDEPVVVADGVSETLGAEASGINV